MEQIEENVINSFKLAKNDIMHILNSVNDLTITQEKLVKRITHLETKNHMILKKLYVVKAKPVKELRTVKRKRYVASKTSKKFHMTNCPFAQNIKPKTKLTFKSKVKALNKGLKPCSCVK